MLLKQIFLTLSSFSKTYTIQDMEYMKIQKEELPCNVIHLNFLGIFNCHRTDQLYYASTSIVCSRFGFCFKGL
jgi:hypothetical protein